MTLESFKGGGPDSEKQKTRVLSHMWILVNDVCALAHKQGKAWKRNKETKRGSKGVQRKGGHMWSENIRGVRRKDTRGEVNVGTKEGRQASRTHFVCKVHNDQDIVVHVLDPSK